MKVNLRVVLSVLVFVAAKSDYADSTPVDLTGNANKGSSTELVKSAESNTNSKEPPLIFPKDGNVYKIVENDTALKILQARAALEPSSPTDVENSTSEKGQNVLAKVESSTVNTDDSIVSNGGSSSSKPSPIDNGKSDTVGNDGDDDDDDYDAEDDDDSDEGESQEDDSDYAAEQVQPEATDKEDGLEEQFGDKNAHYPLIYDNTTIEVSAMRQEHIWIIMLGAVFILALAAYIAMVLYRNRLENRYGMRQRLVTEDDYYLNNEI